MEAYKQYISNLKDLFDKVVEFNKKYHPQNDATIVNKWQRKFSNGTGTETKEFHNPNTGVRMFDLLLVNVYNTIHYQTLLRFQDSRSTDLVEEAKPKFDERIRVLESILIYDKDASIHLLVEGTGTDQSVLCYYCASYSIAQQLQSSNKQTKELNKRIHLLEFENSEMKQRIKLLENKFSPEYDYEEIKSRIDPIRQELKSMYRVFQCAIKKIYNAHN